MPWSSSSSLLRRALVVDAAVSGLAGVAMLLGAHLLQAQLGLPAALLEGAGVSLFPFAALVVHLSRRSGPSAGGTRIVIALNAAWVAASCLLLLSGRVAPSGLGYAFVAGQALAVALFAEAQYVGLRRALTLAA